MKTQHSLSLLALITLGITSSLIFLNFQPTQDETENPLYEKAQQLKRQGRFQAAINTFSKLIQSRPQAPQSHLQIALIQQEELKDNIQAIYHYQQALKQSPPEQQAGIHSRIASAQKDFLIQLPGTLFDTEPMLKELQKEIKELQKENARLKQQMLQIKRIQQPQPSLPTPAPAQPAQPITYATYTVKAGDTLGKISQQFWGSARYWKTLLKDNPQLKDPKKIRIGQVLKVRITRPPEP